MFIRMKDEKYGLLSYLKNYLMRILITTFVLIYVGFICILVYFWLNILSLHSHLKKYNQKKAREIITESNTILTEDMKAQAVNGSSGSIKLIPLNMFRSGVVDSENNAREAGKFYILHV